VLYHLECEGINEYHDSSYHKLGRINIEDTSYNHYLKSLHNAEKIYQQALVGLTDETYIALTEDPVKINLIQTLIRYNVARLFETSGQIDKAEINYREILKAHPAFIDCIFLLILGYLRLGVIESYRGNSEKALDYYSDALAIDPSNTSAWCMVGNHHIQHKSYKAARKAFEKILKEDKNNGYANCRNGFICLYFARNEKDEKIVL
jgi:tetratricopeptide (TPR) repeat protein